MIVRVRVPLPFDQILDFAPSAMSSGIQNLFDLVLFFSVDQIGRGLRKVRPMEVRFLIGGEKIDVKHVVNLLLRSIKRSNSGILSPCIRLE